MNVTVSQLNAYVKQLLQLDGVINDITVCGEISGLTKHSSGHIYFTLKDESATIRCAFFKPYALSLRFEPKNGMKVMARGQVTLYERDGTYQLKVFSMEEDGIGKLYKEFELLKKKLESEGLFSQEHKKSIPKYSKKIGVATSPTGAVIQDILNVSRRRCPNISLVLAPVSVQGDDAPRSICAGIEALDKLKAVDVIIVGRGGGSMEDLWCFNSEEVARAVYSCNKPIISAVGHETDFTICDFVADLRAPTPSAAAELATFDYFDVVQDIEHFLSYLNATVCGKLDKLNASYAELSRAITDPAILIEKRINELNNINGRLSFAIDKKISDAGSRACVAIGRLDALSPLKVLERGFSVATDSNGKIMKKVKDAKIGEAFSLRLNDGSILAEVTNIEKH